MKHSPPLRSMLALVRATLLAVAGLGLHPAAEAQDKPATPAGDTAWLRGWAYLGGASAGETYTLTYSSEKAGVERPLFKGESGHWRTGIGAGYFQIKPGKYRFSLKSDTKPEQPPLVVEEELKKHAAATVFAMVDGGEPKLQVIEERPAAPGNEGVYIYNLVPGVPLTLTVGGHNPVTVPFGATPSILGPGQVTGQTIDLSFPSRRKTQINAQLEYTGERISGVFMYNNYHQPTLVIFPSRPPQQ